MARLSLTIGKLDEIDKVPTALIGSSKRSWRTSTAVGSVRFIPWRRSASDPPLDWIKRTLIGRSGCHLITLP
jgi:hypothetical protein